MLGYVASGLAGLGGLAVGLYAGSALLLPAGLTLGFRWLLGKVIPTANKPMTSASAVHAGHGLWMALGLGFLGKFDLNLIDVVALLGGALWLAVRPSAVAVSLLACCQTFALALNGMAFVAATPGTLVHKTLLVHLFLRLAAVVLMVRGLVEIGRQVPTAPAPGESGDDFDLKLEVAPTDRR